jgi:hypothetical protein
MADDIAGAAHVFDLAPNRIARLKPTAVLKGTASRQVPLPKNSPGCKRSSREA